MPTLNDTELGAILLLRARQAIESYLGIPPAHVDSAHPPATAALGASGGTMAEAESIRLPPDPRLADRGATFVTLTRGGALRGCIGSLRAQRPLGDDVVANAIAAASCDPRFPPLSIGELADTRIEVSLLSAPSFLEFADEDELLRQLHPGEDGLILFSGCRSATFLPQVWEQLPDPRRFLAALKHKAGLPPDHPAPNLMAATYSVRKWQEPLTAGGVDTVMEGTP